MNKQELDAIIARYEAATEGPWKGRAIYWLLRYQYKTGLSVVCEELTDTDEFPETPEDAEFIAHARTDIPVLVAHVEAQAVEIARRDNALAITCDIGQAELDNLYAEITRLKSEKAALVGACDRVIKHVNIAAKEGFTNGDIDLQAIVAYLKRQVATAQAERCVNERNQTATAKAKGNTK